jgi:hypothetical protein
MQRMKVYLKHIRTVLLVFICCQISAELYAQTMTEIYIPVGQSPGVSGKYSIMGRIESVNLKDSTVTMIPTTGNKITIKITAGCAIYLDKSKLKQSNKKGYCTDMKQGMLAEAKYRDNKPGNKIEWVKVQIE